MATYAGRVSDDVCAVAFADFLAHADTHASARGNPSRSGRATIPNPEGRGEVFYVVTVSLINQDIPDGLTADQRKAWAKRKSAQRAIAQADEVLADLG